MNHTDPNVLTSNILVVDDNPANLRLLIDILRKVGYKVRPANHGQLALMAIEKEPPDLILLDIRMPDMDGYEICEHLKANEQTCDIPVIFFSTLSEVFDKVNAFNVGGVDYIIKPFHEAEILARIKTHLALQNMQKQLEVQNLQLQQEVRERKRAEETLKRSENSLKQAQRMAHLGNWDWNIVNNELFWSDEIYRIFGIEPYKFDATYEAFLNTVHPDDRADVQKSLNDAIYEQKPYSIEHRIILPDGEIRFVHEQAVVTFDEDNQAIQMVGTVHDITERKQAEEAKALVHFNQQLNELNKAYERFVPHEFLSLLDKKSIIDVQLGDQVEKEMTILFSDIRHFTAMSEKMTPQDNFEFINAYLGQMEPIIHQYKGIIDKYIGDAIMALFPTSADDALNGSIAMLKALTKYNNLLQRTEFEIIRIGIGLHTGKLMLGTIGGQKRMDGTVISDAVNLASRIEGMNKMYGTTLLISEETYSRLSDVSQYAIRIIDKVKVKGKSESVTIYEVFDGDAPSVIDLKMKTRDNFEAGLIHYRQKAFLEAIQCFQNILHVHPEDFAAQIYLKRCEHFQKVGVSDNWEGVEALEHK
jgi:PAS domain S-box-containing protein